MTRAAPGSVPRKALAAGKGDLPASAVKLPRRSSEAAVGFLAYGEA